jgi:hypothetical protein
MRHVEKSDFQKWIGCPSLNMFVTATLKQGISSPHGYPIPICQHDVVRTAWLLRDRSVKNLIGKSAFKRGERLGFLAFAEGDGLIKRRHLHVLSQVPPGVSPAEYHHLIKAIASRLEWVHREIHVEALTYGASGRGHEPIRYCLKEGFDAFLPEASFLSPVHEGCWLFATERKHRILKLCRTARSSLDCSLQPNTK